MKAGVKVKFAGGLSADTKKMLEPLMGLVMAAAGRVRHRVQVRRKDYRGQSFGKYRVYRRGHKRRVPVGAAINFTDKGGMWDGLTAKMQKSGARITINFSGSSASKDKRKGYKSSNKDKAWYSSQPWIRRGINLLAWSKAEHQAFWGEVAKRSLLSLLKSAKDRQEFAREIEKKYGSGDPGMKAALRGAKNVRATTKKIKRSR